LTELADSHAHLQGSEFEADRDAVIERAQAAGVTTIIVPGVDGETTEEAISLAERYEGIYATAGFHPHEASRLDDWSLTRIESMLAHPRVVAVGEIGLDFYRDLSPRERQMEAFESQLALAERHTIPVVIHCRDAWEALAEQLVPWAERVSASFDQRPLGVLHYYSSDLATAQRYIDLGFLISIHTSVTHPRAEALREVLVGLPLEALLVETDSPYGTPQAYRGTRNEPAYLVEAAKRIAAVKGVTLEEVAAATTFNATRLFPECAAVHNGAARAGG
jgi:TatD DNase family protein